MPDVSQNKRQRMGSGSPSYAGGEVESGRQSETIRSARHTLLTREQAAARLGFSMTTLNRRLASGALKADVIDPATGKLYFYPDVAERYFKPINNGSHLREPLEISIERVLARRKANAVKRYNTTYIKKRQ